MEQILQHFIDNNEANDAYVTSKVTYISLEDVDTLLKRQKQQLTIPVVGCSLPSKKIIDYLESSEDFYIDDSKKANRFYNAALNDVKYFIEKEEEKLK